MSSDVSSRLDTFNSLLYGIPKHEVDKIQRIQNAAARVVSLTHKNEHITPVLMSLHWLPIAKRVEYKILLLTYKALHGLAPQYLTDLLQVSNNQRTLRSNNKFLLVIPKTESVKYGDSSFAYAAASLWNTLPEDCRMAQTLQLFKSRLKTHLFKLAFDC